MPNLKFKNFQIDDYARIAMRDGSILAHDTGLGKSLATFAIPLIKENVRRVLIVAPESLHLQIRETARNFFGVTVFNLLDHETFHEWNLAEQAEPLEEGRKPAFFLTTYQALGHNGADEWAATEKWDETDTNFEMVSTPQLEAKRAAWFRRNGWTTQPTEAATGAAKVGPGFVRHRANMGSSYEIAYLTAGIGTEKSVGNDHKITCVWTPSLARLINIHNSFDFVVVDEGVRVQSNDAHIATGVRLLNPKYRLLLSATPIKNRLESLFWLAWWAAGGTEQANPRWPYGGTAEEREKFADQHLLMDKYLTRETAAFNTTGLKKSVSRRSARITNIHKLWKIVAPIVLRRRKSGCGEDIVPKTNHVTKVKQGKRQHELYQHYLMNPPTIGETGRQSAGAQLTLLRQATLVPYTELMKQHGPTSHYYLNPKIVAILAIVQDCLNRGEQVVIGSNFLEFGSTMLRLLKESGVVTCLLDGRMDPVKRGRTARDFKDGFYSVMVAGIQAMGEGHSFDMCPNLILPSLDWAYDVNSQFVDRVWRMNSSKPVNVYTVATKDTVDEYLLEIFKEKEDSSQLALDGALQAADMDEASVGALLEKSFKGFKQKADVIDEVTLEKEWPTISKRLASAQRKFVKLRGVAA